LEKNELYNLNNLPDLRSYVLKIDLTVENSNPIDYENAHLGYYSTDLMDQWLKYCPCLHTLTILIKSLLNVRNLNITYKGGLSSYCVIMMIIAYLKEYNMSFHKDISLILQSLLNFYGNNFEPETTGINLAQEARYIKKF
jgi:DNA polymerase sigma